MGSVNTIWCYLNNHYYLLSNIAVNSDLSDVEFTEVAPGLDADNSVPYQLVATIAGQTYHRQATNYGDWYDLDAVLALLNHIAWDRNSQQGFVTLPTGDQTAIVWVVDANALELLQGQGLLQVSSAELSLATGKEFEQQVIDTLGVSEH